MSNESTASTLGSLLAPSSVAIVGASPTSYVGRVLCENLRSIGYEGAVYPVNPRHEEVLGWRCYPSIEALPEGPQSVVAAVPYPSVPEALRAAGERGTRAAVVPGGGFTETGPEALGIQDEIIRVAGRFSMALCGPNCMGVIAPGRRAALYIGTIPSGLLAGSVTLLSQSGSVVEAAVNMGPRIGFSALVSFGNEAVTTIGEYLRFFAGDEETRAVVVFVEGFRDPAGFVVGARALREAGKPLAVLQAGRSAEAAAAIAAHSGSLAGAEEVVRGLLRQLGAIRVDDLDELFELAELLGHGRLPAGRRVFMVTDSGGEANLVADHARLAGLELPAPSSALTRRLRDRWPNFSYIGNPVDPWGVDPDYRTLYSEILRAGAAEDVDVVAVALDKVTPWAGRNEVDLGVAAAEALIGATSGGSRMGVFLTVPSTGPAARDVRSPLREAGIPLLHGVRPAMLALARAWWWGQWRPRTPPSLHGRPIGLPRRRRGEGSILSERESREILAAYGVPLVPALFAATAEEAMAAADRLGYPAVVKADAPGVAHKAAAGLVATGLPSRAAVARAFDELTAGARQAGVVAPGVLVQATAAGVELICGMRRDPLFGPVVVLGAGGALTEVLRDVAVRVCPVAEEDLHEMLAECAAGRLVDASGADPVAVSSIVAALARLGGEHPEVAEVDVNPVFAGAGGVLGADALVVMDPSGG